MSFHARTVYSAGGATSYGVPFPYLSKSHVHVLDNGAEYTGSISWDSSAILRLTPDIASGHSVTVLRVTPTDPLVVYSGGAIASTDLNVDALQALYLAEEGADNFVTLSAGGTIIIDNSSGGGGGGSTTIDSGDVTTALGFTPAKQDLTNVTASSLRDAMLLVHGGGTRQRSLGTILEDAANINDFLNTGDTNYDGAWSRAMADKGKVYLPAGPALGGNQYTTAVGFPVASGQTVIGDGSATSVLACTTANLPTLIIGTSILNIVLRGIGITHTVTATSGGHGISMGQGLLDWVNNGLWDDVYSYNNWDNYHLGKCFSCHIRDCNATGALHDNWSFTTTGHATGLSGFDVGGPLQWVLENPASGSAANDGYAYHVTGTALGGSGVGSSLGTLYNPVTFASGHHGIAYYGSAAHPLNSVRIFGGFIGQDAGNGIYMDTYATDHVVKPDFMELAGQYNCQITANNANVVFQPGLVNGANWDGLYTAAENTMVPSGFFKNNGLAGTGVDNFAGIIVAGGSFRGGSDLVSQNFNSAYQQYGLRTSVDTLHLTGCAFPPPGTTGSSSATINGALVSAANIGNVLGSIGSSVTLTNSIITGCSPTSINNSGGALSGGTITGDVTITGKLRVNNSIGINTAPTGTAGDITATTIHSSGAAAFAAGVFVTGVGISVSAGAGGLLVDNIQARTSLGVGTSAPGTAGTIAAGAGFFSGALSGASLTSASGLVVSGTVSGVTTLTAQTVNASTDIATTGSGTAHFAGSGGVAFTGAGGITITQGGINLSAGGASNGLIVDNLNVRTSLGVGGGTNGTATNTVGEVTIATNVKVGGTAVTVP